jgi:serine/threonine protein kinase, bacterial
VLPFTGLTVPWGIGLGSSGGVYVTDHDTSQVVKLAAGANAAAALRFTGLNTPLGVAVAADGKVYVGDRGNDRVVQIAGSSSN